MLRASELLEQQFLKVWQSSCNHQIYDPTRILLRNFHFGHRENRKSIAMLWRRNLGASGKRLILKIKGLSPVDSGETGAVDNHIARRGDKVAVVLLRARHPGLYAQIPDIPSSGIFRVVDSRRCSEPMKSRVRSRSTRNITVLQIGSCSRTVLSFGQNQEPSRRRPLHRDRSCNQERAPKRNARFCSRVRH